jgi:predicted small lipoprotein YifL
MRLITLVIGVLLLSACGMTGDLYLPGQPAVTPGSATLPAPSPGEQDQRKAIPPPPRDDLAR